MAQSKCFVCGLDMAVCVGNLNTKVLAEGACKASGRSGTYAKPPAGDAALVEWQTQGTQNPPPSQASEFDSRGRHHQGRTP